jgi:plastocyanin domain-containing protein
LLELVAVTAAAIGIVAVVLVCVARSRRRRNSTAQVSKDGYQEATIRINRRYRPEVVTVQSGRPVRLRFLREEDTPCSERVIFEGLGIDRRLQAHRETLVELKPVPAGSYMFTCQMGVYRGWLVATGQR